MTKLIDILKPKVSEALLLGQLKSAYETTPGDERSAMLHAKDDYAFRVVCKNGHLEIAKWLWNVCSEQEQKAMLHARDDHAFCLACQNGHLAIAEWLWGICPDEEQSAMLHAADDYAFRWACENGQLQLAKWLLSLCTTHQERYEMLHLNYNNDESSYESEECHDYPFHIACYEGHLEIAKWLWSYCVTPKERSAMLHSRRDDGFGFAIFYGHFHMAKWLWAICPDDEQSEMLYACEHYPFRMACHDGRLEIAKWLWGICSKQNRLEMLHAEGDYAFSNACSEGHLETARWLWTVCPDQERLKMLHTNNYDFFHAYRKGHLEVAQWLFDLYETDLRLRIYKGFKKITGFWHQLNEFEQIHIFNDPNWLVTMIKNKHSINDIQALISTSQRDDVKSDLKTSLYKFQFRSIINALYALNPSFDEYLNYIKGCKDHNKHHFIKWQMDYMVRKAINAKKTDLLLKVLNGLEPLDLISEHKLAGWLSLAKQEGNTVFQDVYISAVWRGDLYQVLEKDNNATHYESLIVMIRVLFKHGLSLSTLMKRVMQDEQAGVGEWWCFLFQGVITNMLTEDPTSITHFKHLLESFCEHPLVRYDHEVGSNKDTEYQERCLTIITWFESECQKAANNSSKWTKDELWKMFQQLSLGSGITMGDDHNSRINKLAEFKQQLETEVKRIQGALDVCSVMDGAGFEEHFGYAPNSASTSSYPCKGKRQALLGQVDKHDQSCMKQGREDQAITFYSNHYKRKMDIGSAENPDQKRCRTDSEAGPSNS